MDGEVLRGRLLQIMKGREYRPMNKSELARHLEIPSAKRQQLRAELARLEREGKIVEGKKGRYELTRKSGGMRLRGRLKFHPKGFAWFYPAMEDAENLASGLDLDTLSRIYVERRDAGTALDGDTVMVSVKLPSKKRFDGDRRRSRFEEEPEATAKVEQVLERRSGRVVGVFHKKGKHAWVDATDLGLEGPVELVVESTAQPGQQVVVALEQWSGRNLSPRGRVVEVLGWPGDPGVDIMAIIHRFGLHSAFPDEVLAAARSVEETPDPTEVARREDWRDKLVITIDPADAKDHDDAIWVEPLQKGWRVAVHIADVSHYVKPGTALDKEAQRRGNSTYLVDRVLPMLPPELSNGICSLKPDVDRLTKCVVAEVNERGDVHKVHFVDAVIHSRAKLSYEQAQVILDGGDAPEGSESGLVEMVRVAWDMASTLRRKRFRDGALDLEMPEVRVRLDDQGRANAVEPVVHTPSHQLIEECMLLANEAVARLLKHRQKPTVYRVHEDPDFDKLNEFGETARQHGYKPGDLSNRAHIQKLLDDARGRPDEHAIKLGLLKSLKRAAYAPDPYGHFGLAKSDYTHFTSPIRRYADLLVHRALQPLLENPPTTFDRVPKQATLGEISSHISDTERNSADAEMESKRLKMNEYLMRTAGQEDSPVFTGLVTDVRRHGLFVEATDIGVKGLIKCEDLPGEWWYDPGRNEFASRGGLSLSLGTPIQMQVIRVDSERGFVDFRLFGDAPKGSVMQRGKEAFDSAQPRKRGKAGDRRGKADPPFEMFSMKAGKGGKKGKPSSSSRPTSRKQARKGGSGQGRSGPPKGPRK